MNESTARPPRRVLFARIRPPPYTETTNTRSGTTNDSTTNQARKLPALRRCLARSSLPDLGRPRTNMYERERRESNTFNLSGALLLNPFDCSFSLLGGSVVSKNVSNVNCIRLRRIEQRDECSHGSFLRANE